MTLSALVVVVLSPLPNLWRHVYRSLGPQGHVVIGAPTLEDARRRRVRPDVLAIDGQLLCRCGWRGRELAETLDPEWPAPVLGLVERESDRPPREIDLGRRGIVTLYEPFQAAELSLVVNWLGRKARGAH